MSIENDRVVCLCKAVLESTIKEAIRQGAQTSESVKIRTGATSGACKGSRCKNQIEELIASYQKGEWQ